MMPQSIIIESGIATICKTDFECPKCEYLHGEEFYTKKLQIVKQGFVYKKCKGCKNTLGITTN